jgi:four helix bundle protein
MRDHTKLRAFELADELALMIYRITRDFPKEEVFILTSQLRRAAISVPSNITEGSARNAKAEYLRFLDIAYGSLKELHYQISLAVRLGYINEIKSTECELKILETEKVLASLIRSLRNQSPNPLIP